MCIIDNLKDKLWHQHFAFVDHPHIILSILAPFYCKSSQCEIFHSKCSCSTYQLLLSTASPKPGVSQIVSLKDTPFSLIKTLVVSTCKRQRCRYSITNKGLTTGTNTPNLKYVLPVTAPSNYKQLNAQVHTKIIAIYYHLKCSPLLKKRCFQACNSMFHWSYNIDGFSHCKTNTSSSER